MSALHQLLALDTELRYGSYPKFVLELGLFKLAHLQEFLSVDELIDGLEASDPAPQAPAVRDNQAGFKSGYSAPVRQNRPAEPVSAEKKKRRAGQCGRSRIRRRRAELRILFTESGAGLHCAGFTAEKG